MALTALDFLSQRLLDRDAGGTFGATDVTGRHPLSTDKHLPDQASAVLALTLHGSAADVAVAVEGLCQMQDKHGHPGFVEQADRYWRAYPAGRVRTVRFQLHAAAALLAAAHRLDRDDLRARAVDVLNRCLSTAVDGRFPSRLAENWQPLPGDAGTPQTNVSAVRAIALAHEVGESDVDTGALPAVAGVLLRLIEQGNWPRPAPVLTRCSSVGRIVLALAHAGRMLGADEYLKAADTTLASAVGYFYDPDHGGFWDVLAPNGSARVDWVDAPHAAGPFPVKRATDAAQVLVAGELLARSGADTGQTVDRARDAVAALVDHRHGGVYLGIGYQWATAVEPAVPSMQQLWARPKWPGLLENGTLAHLALQQKSAHAHATVVRAVGAAVPRPSRPAARRNERVRIVTTARPDPAVAARVDTGVRLPLDRVGYLRTLLGTRTHLSGGAVTQGLHANADVSLVYHTIADVRVLDGQRDLVTGALESVRRAQNGDGGWGELPGQLSDVSSTYCAVLGLHLGGLAPERPDAARTYLRQCENADGGFGAVPGLGSDVSHTAFALAALHVLGAAPASPSDCARWVLSCRTPDGGYGTKPGAPATTAATRHALAVLALTGVVPPAPAATVAWLRACQVSNGGFALRPGAAASALGTYHALAALALLGEAAVRADACERWLTAQQHDHGLFEFHDGLPPEADDGFACLQSLALLRRAVNREWVMLIG